MVAGTLEYDAQRDLGFLPMIGGISATALYATAEAGWSGRRVGGFLGAFVLAVALHTAWDSQKSLIGPVIVAVVSLVALGWTVHRISHSRH